MTNCNITRNTDYKLSDNPTIFETLRRHNFEVHYTCKDKNLNFEILKMATSSIRKYEENGEIYFEITWDLFLEVLDTLQKFLDSYNQQINVKFFSPDYSICVFSDAHIIEPVSVIQYNLDYSNSDKFKVSITFKKK